MIAIGNWLSAVVQLFDHILRALLGEAFFSVLLEVLMFLVAFGLIASIRGEHFKAYESDLKKTYTKQVSELPATGITSSGGLIWNPVTTSGSASYYSNSVVGTKYYSFSSLPYEVMNGSSSLGTLALSGSAIVWSISNTLIKHGLSFSSFVIPISGSYRRLESTKFTVSGILESGNSFNYTDYYTLESFSHYEVGTSFSVSGGFYQYGSGEIPSEFFLLDV